MSEKPLQPGDLNCRIVLRRLEAGVGELGEPLPGIPIVVGRAWAIVEPVSNRKIRTADQQQVVETVLLTTWPRDDVSIDWQVLVKNAVFTVTNVDRSVSDRIVIRGEADTRHDRASN